MAGVADECTCTPAMCHRQQASSTRQISSDRTLVVPAACSRVHASTRASHRFAFASSLVLSARSHGLTRARSEAVVPAGGARGECWTTCYPGGYLSVSARCRRCARCARSSADRCISQLFKFFVRLFAFPNLKV